MITSWKRFRPQPRKRPRRQLQQPEAPARHLDHAVGAGRTQQVAMSAMAQDHDLRRAVAHACQHDGAKQLRHATRAHDQDAWPDANRCLRRYDALKQLPRASFLRSLPARAGSHCDAGRRSVATATCRTGKPTGVGFTSVGRLDLRISKGGFSTRPTPLQQSKSQAEAAFRTSPTHANCYGRLARSVARRRHRGAAVLHRSRAPRAASGRPRRHSVRARADGGNASA